MVQKIPEQPSSKPAIVSVTRENYKPVKYDQNSSEEDEPVGRMPNAKP